MIHPPTDQSFNVDCEKIIFCNEFKWELKVFDALEWLSIAIKVEPVAGQQKSEKSQKWNENVKNKKSWINFYINGNKKHSQFSGRPLYCTKL